jgi:branched-chain amino acid transport system substrate-binding protein
VKAGWLIAAAGLVAAACGGSSKPAAPLLPNGTVSFGVLAPLSGARAARGQDLVNGAKLAADDLNVRGGVVGKRVEVVTADDRCDASDGRAGAEKLTRVAGTLGGVCDASARAAARTFSRADMPFLVTSANSPRIVNPDRTPTTYLTDGTPYQEALAVVHWLATTQTQRLAVVGDADAASSYLTLQVAGLSDPTPQAVSRQTVPKAGADFAALAKIALVSKPDVVYFAGTPAHSGRVLAALRAAGFKDRFVASASSEDPAFLSAAGPAADGAFVVANASPQNLPAAARWTQRFTKRFGHPPGRDAMLAYDALRALAQAVTQSGKVDRAANGRQLTLLDPDEFKTFLGDLEFAPDHTVKDDNHIVLTARDGAFRVATTLRSYEG